ncbi:TolC family protein [Winogradskyella psychrotolerans]|uniref:TolC family protein n=1 Tax=Winogradskyella psychrotolerans TaxID=1344585 RepID=UPI001C07A7F3|nr:TolC family protein [Winogradskyella psychrotolerans]MBU2922436.1 TolC family protein [Winogradskyella psychrotolerans]
MKKQIIIIFLFLGVIAQAQNKKWTLLECVNYALENNISIKQSDLDVDLADIDKKQASSNFLPNLNSNVSYNINTGANINPATNQFENNTFKSASSGLNSSINIFSGLSNWKTLQRAKINKIASEYRLEKMKDDISLIVANSFLQILANREQLKVLQSQNKLTKENLENTQELVNAGVLPQGDLLEIRATDATQAQQIIAAENALFLSKLGLAQTLQLKDYESFDIADDDYGLVPADILDKDASEIVAKAKEEVNDIKIAQTSFELAQKDLELARTSYYPTLSGFLGYNTRWASTQIDPLTGGDIPFVDQLYIFDGTSVGLQLNVPIFNRFTVRNNVKRSKVNVERLKYQLEQTEIDLESTVYQAYNDAKNSKKSYEAALQTEEARRLAFEYAKERYDVGLSNAFDFNQSRATYENSQSDVVRTKYDYIFRLKILEFYFGLPITDLN